MLLGIIQHSTSKKIDVDELRLKLAESMKREATIKRSDRKGSSRSPRSDFDDHTTLHNVDSEQEAP